MLGGIFNKRKKSPDLRSLSLQDVKKFRDTYAKYAELRHVETPPCLEKSINKAIAGQNELHMIELRQEDITDQQVIVLAETMLEMPIVSSLDLRDNRITDDGAKALLEVLRLQIISAKSLPPFNVRSKQYIRTPMPEYTRFVIEINLRGNEVSAFVLQEFSQYMDLLRREDKRLEIRVALNRVGRKDDGKFDEEEYKGVLKLLNASTPTNKDIRTFMQLSSDNSENVANFENILLAKCAVSPSKLSACPPWEALVQERHATLGSPGMAPTTLSKVSDVSTLIAPPSHSKVSSFDSGMATKFGTSSSYLPEVPSLSPCTTRAAAIALIDTKIGVTNLSPPPTFSTPIAVQQAVTTISDANSAPLSSDHVASYLSPAPITSTTEKPMSSRSQLSFDEGRHRNSRPVQSIISGEGKQLMPSTEQSKSNSAPSSPNNSDISDSIEIAASSGEIASKRVFDKDQPVKIDRILYKDALAENGVDCSAADSISLLKRDADESSPSTADIDVHGKDGVHVDNGVHLDTRHRHCKVDMVCGYGNKCHAYPIQKYFKNETTEEVSVKKTQSSIAEKISIFESAGRTRLNNIEAVKSCEMRVDGDAICIRNNAACALHDSEEDEGCVESLAFDVLKDGKERSVVKLTHPEFRKNMTIKNFPAEVPCQNLLALLLPANGLTNLHLFAECRFPFVTVLDLSRNKLTKLPDDGLIAFPRLEVLNLERNQLKLISGLTTTFKLRALGLSHNVIRILKNIEHLFQLEILDLAHNVIATAHALRFLSLNKMLSHLNLDGNPVVEADECQKRKNIVHVRNLLPALQSLGSILLTHCKFKKAVSSISKPSNSLFDNDLMPDYRKSWVTNACDTLSIVQDGKTHCAAQIQSDQRCDTTDEDEGEKRIRSTSSRDQQRQNDELRSQSLGSRSRRKAPPLSSKKETSLFCFGPPQLSSAKKKKKLVPSDPSVVREQQRRANELSAPKHTKVDRTLMEQERKRRPRVDFDGALTVGERLQLAQDLTQRRPIATTGFSTRSRYILDKAERSRSRTNIAFETSMEEEFSRAEENLLTMSRPPSPQSSSPLNKSLVFCKKEAPSPKSPKKARTIVKDPFSVDINGHFDLPKSSESKETDFLHDLAVLDFLGHAKEGLSTTLTALNVLLTMSEKEHGDPKKVAEYRVSLDALDILDEHESRELYKSAQNHADVELQTQCADWFTKLSVAKKCLRQLLEKLESHAPGSEEIRAYCQYIRSNELHEITIAIPKAQADSPSQPKTTEAEKENSVAETDYKMPAHGSNGEIMNQVKPILASQTSQLLGTSRAEDMHNDYSHTCDSAIEEIVNDDQTSTSTAKVAHLHHSEPTDIERDETEKIDDLEAQRTNSQPKANVLSVLTENHAFHSKSDATNELLVDIQKDHSVDETFEKHQWHVSAAEHIDNSGGTGEMSVHDKDDPLESTDEAIKLDNIENYAQNVVGDTEEATVFFTSTEAATTQIEDYDWLETPLDLTVDLREADSFRKEMDAVSGDELDTAFFHEQSEVGQVHESLNYEATESFDEKKNEACQEYINEEEIVEASVVYNVDRKFVTEDLNAIETPNEPGDDADDEESEMFGDWEKGFDINSNHYFWFNHNTGESTWIPPEGWPYEVDNLCDSEDATESEKEQQEFKLDQASEEYENGEVIVDGETKDGGAAESRYWEERTSDQAFEQEESVGDAKTYDVDAAKSQYDIGRKFVGRIFEESAVEDDESAFVDVNEGGITKERQQEANTAYDSWYDEKASKEDQGYHFYAEEEGRDESPRRSEVSDFEFDDSDLPGL